MAVADRNGLPVAVCVESATPHEVKLVIPTLVQMVIPDAPRNLIGDNAYDSDKLDTKLGSYGMSDPPQNLPDNAPVVKGVGFKHYVIHAVWERMRWHYTVDNKLCRRDLYRCNNDYTSRYARLIMRQEPALKGFFLTRELKSK